MDITTVHMTKRYYQFLNVNVLNAVIIEEMSTNMLSISSVLFKLNTVCDRPASWLYHHKNS